MYGWTTTHGGLIRLIFVIAFFLSFHVHNVNDRWLLSHIQQVEILCCNILVPCKTLYCCCLVVEDSCRRCYVIVTTE